MNPKPPGAARVFVAPDGARWEAAIVARGPASPYLSARVGRPIVQFGCVDAPGRPRRYAALPGAGLFSLDDRALAALWARARRY